MIGLTIDLDYFQVEDTMWDWSHSEENALYTTPFIWTVRHQSVDIFNLCDVEHADIHPTLLFGHLKNQDLILRKSR